MTHMIYIADAWKVFHHRGRLSRMTCVYCEGFPTKDEASLYLARYVAQEVEQHVDSEALSRLKGMFDEHGMIRNRDDLINVAMVVDALYNSKLIPFSIAAHVGATSVELK